MAELIKAARKLHPDRANQSEDVGKAIEKVREAQHLKIAAASEALFDLLKQL